MKALVTGATGFVGSHLVEALLRRGIAVRTVARSTSSLAWLPSLPVEVMCGDLADPALASRALDGVDRVFHVAGAYGSGSLKALLAANLATTQALVEAAADRGTPPRFVLVSSYAAIGPGDGSEPLDEAAPYRPMGPYGVSKMEAEKLALGWAGRVPVTVVRPPGVYGPRDRNFLPLFRWASRGLLPRFASVERRSDLIHVGDLARGLILASEVERAAGEAYFLADPSSYRMFSDFAARIGAAAGARIRRFYIPLWLMSGLTTALAATRSGLGSDDLPDPSAVALIRAPCWSANTRKAHVHLGFSPSFTLERGIAETLDWYRSAGWIR